MQARSLTTQKESAALPWPATRLSYKLRFASTVLFGGCLTYEATRTSPWA